MPVSSALFQNKVSPGIWSCVVWEKFSDILDGNPDDRMTVNFHQTTQCHKPECMIFTVDIMRTSHLVFSVTYTLVFAVMTKCKQIGCCCCGFGGICLKLQYYTTWCHNLEHHNMSPQHHENSKCHSTAVKITNDINHHWLRYKSRWALSYSIYKR